SRRSGRQSIHPGQVAAFGLSHASRAWFSFRSSPGVPLRSTPGFMLPPAARVWNVSPSEIPKSEQPRRGSKMKPAALDRRNFLSLTGKSLGLAAITSSTVGSLLTKIHAATKTDAHLTPEQAAMDEDFWF